ncbi:hypothetical protein B0J13DRAFT_172074 [Dactylonectria estremocensis]|uniref:LYC1 C-terminal domain-containing protein n=1 Tax=Dactylonectria estremocensis TaxID=1079267 RepID=A0A9P9FBK2_9HYPO|nr:hypothetical protein B0J13DRAFT_172074 [Dactylonectria estremocensis]
MPDYPFGWKVQTMPYYSEKDLVFERAQGGQITKHFMNIAQVWAGSMSQAAFLDMQEKLADTKASIGSMTTWILRCRKNLHALVSSCTTYTRDAITTTGQGTRPSRVVIITNVFTIPERRMEGMAKLLLNKLKEELDKGTFGDVEFSVVYGHAYKDLFQGLGWKPQPATQLSIFLNSKLPEQFRDDVPQVTFLKYIGVKGLADQDVNTSKLRLSGHRDGKVHVQILPTELLLAWHMTRSRLIFNHIGPSGMRDQRYGVISDPPQLRAWISWVHDFDTRRLCITRIFAVRRDGMEDIVRSLLMAAVVEASVCGLRQVVIWEPSDQVVRASAVLPDLFCDGVSVSQGERMEMVPCLRWKGGEDKDVVMEESQLYGSS